MARELNPEFIGQLRQTIADITDPDPLIDALTLTDPVVSVRINPRKPAELPWTESERVPWCENGVYLPSRPVFTLQPELHQGRFYVQDASSMFIYYILRQLCHAETPLVYLDACAAPGGKTTAAIDALPDRSLVVANEYEPRRATVLRENLIKWGYPDLVVTQGDTASFRKVGEMFDIVAADVPCSGEGMMRKDQEAVAQWSPGLVRECVARQREILANLWPSLKPGGLFIYSTCTFNKDENEKMVEWMTDNFGCHTVKLSLPSDCGIVVSSPREGIECYRFMPHLVRGEGLFMAVLRKPGEGESTASQKKNRSKNKPAGKPDLAISKCGEWINNPRDYEIARTGDLLTAFPKQYAPQLETLRKQCKVIQAGVALATLKGKNAIPEHALALSSLFNMNQFPTAELSEQQALSYLRRETINLPESTPRGFVVVTYSGRPLGFVKNLGNRSNNLYPQGWRILKIVF